MKPNYLLYATSGDYHGAGLDCTDEQCQECCEHFEFDHNICLDCGMEFDILPGQDEDYGEER